MKRVQEGGKERAGSSGSLGCDLAGKAIAGHGSSRGLERSGDGEECRNGRH